jgi:hypothetical protein
VVRTADLSVQVSDVDRAAATVLLWTARAGGRVDGDDRASKDGARHAQLVLRLPPAKLDPAIDQVSRLGTEVSRTVHGQDVTAAHADVNARVAALRTSVGRLTGFLKASGSVTDLVALETQLSQRESELESTVAQQRALSDQIALCTLTVDLSVTPVGTAGGHGSLPSGFGSAVIGGLRVLLIAARWSLAVFGYLLPFGVLALAVLVPVGWLRRRRTAQSPVPPPVGG